ncbi:UDP-glucose:glycoprotein glucosyltransferase-domain-containing protein [Entophlyctis helioformis]|nr:UDP-glucose:glycoprotein glucosyltransferase-domain-containing protein [Entophlyctis helioformis]
MPSGVAAAAAGAAATAVPPVNVWLKTPDAWQAPPLALELLEFAAQEPAGSVFPLLSHLSAHGLLGQSVKPRQIYDALFNAPAPQADPGAEAVSHAVNTSTSIRPFLSSPASETLAKLSLAIHSTAPRIEAFHRFYQQSVVPSFKRGFNQNCAVWVDWNHRQICSPADLERLIAAPIQPFQNKPDLLDFDHVYAPSASATDASSKPNLPTVILYADISAPSFGGFYTMLIDAADRNLVQLILRYIPSGVASKTSADSPLYLSGYGVELAIKSTEYKVEDDRDIKAASDGQAKDDRPLQQPDESAAVHEDDPLFEPVPVIKALRKDQIDEIGFKAASYIAESATPFDALSRVSQDFPKYAHLLASRPVNESVRQLALSLQQLSPEPNMLFLNGIPIDLDRFDAFHLLRRMRDEVQVISALESLSWSASDAIQILSTSLTKQSGPRWGECFDTRSDAVVWLNDLEKDSRYRNFPSSLSDLLRPSHPGQLKMTKRNIFSAIFVVDLTNALHINLVRTAFHYIESNLCLRFGFALLVENGDLEHQSSVAALASHWFIANSKKKLFKEFVGKLGESTIKDGPLDSAKVKSIFQEVSGQSYDAAVGTLGDENTKQMDTLAGYATRLGVDRSDGAIFANGKHIAIADGWQQRLVETYFEMVQYLANLVYLRKIEDKENVYEYFMTMPNVYPKRNSLIFGSASFVNWVDTPKQGRLTDLAWLYGPSATNFADMSLVVFGDLSTPAGFAFAQAALDAAAISTTSVRVAVVHNPAAASDKDHGVLLDEAIQHAVLHRVAGQSPLDAVREAAKSIASGTAFDASHRAPEVVGRRANALLSILSGSHAKPGSYGIIANARIVSPLDPANLFDINDFSALLSYETTQRTANLADQIKFLRVLEDDEASEVKDADVAATSDLIFLTQSLVVAAASGNDDFGLGSPAQRISPSQFASLRQSAGAFSQGDFTAAALQFTLVVNPATHVGQKAAGLLETLTKMDNVAVEVFLNPQSVHGSDKLPVTRFYRYVLSHEPTFDEDGYLAPVGVSFKRIPKAPLLTLGMDVIGAWLVRPTRSIYDLDNIKLSSLSADAIAVGVEADFVLQSILVEGHARDVFINSPPRGLQFILGTDRNPALVDTITMDNLGYVQLKANPGVWSLGIREGRSRDVYQFESVTYALRAGRARADASALANADGARVVVDSFEGVTLILRVSKRRGMETQELLPTEVAAKGGFWNSMKARLKNSVLSGLGGSALSGTDETINVFSVASGHLYERFLSIMMLSVKQQTKSPVKFWLIENFLSPSFMEFLPHLAKAYGFEYELVTCEWWPKWLREQTEKQRIIWGYKILFLDVLFPLKVDKVIFVDADQVVRTDLKELVDMDLGGAVYGYTPFCSDRTEMDGFRFWRTGYWHDFLQGKPYHISALYVVDLVKFREVAAGDRLRQQYHSLSADPHSLANLDQDLPNSMAHAIPIFSLPQEWLWCETWCSDESLKRAKTIDLCNNPMTKEPKLERARRILPEWEGLDRQVQAVRDRFEKRQSRQPPAAKTGRAAAAGGGGGGGGGGSHSEL